MADYERYDREEHEGSGASFMMGLLTGTVLGAGLGMLFAPKSGSELRHQLEEKASSLGRTASEQYRRASDKATGIAEKAREKIEHVRSRSSETMRGEGGESGGGADFGTSAGAPTSTYTGGSEPYRSDRS
ncbi:MAG TPA: YtxH domain-containing protein [Vicinamibacterales bacterium]|nr:YtxH domain-containing protein [Vicinamibacterales bacterium]